VSDDREYSDYSRIADNIQQLQSDNKGDPNLPGLIDKYLAHEGLTADSFARGYSRAQATGFNTPAHYGPIDGLAANIQHGLFFGWDPEIAAASSAVLEKLSGNDQDFHSLYSNLKEMYRQSLQNYQSDHPDVSGYETATGAALPALATMGATAPESAAVELSESAPTLLKSAQNVGKQSITGATVGAPAGAVAGAGEAGPDNRMSGAVKGEIVGGAGGAVMAPVVAALANVPRYAGAAKDWVSGELDSLSARIDKLRGTPPPVAAPGAAAGASAQSSPEDAAIIHALLKDGVTPEAVATELNAATAAGQPMTMVDAASRATLRLARGARSLSDEANNAIDDALESRDAEQPTRVLDFLEPALGQARNTDALGNAIIAQRAQAAKPAYETAYQTGPLVDPELHAKLAVPAFKAAHESASGQMQDVGAGNTPPLFNEMGNLTRAPTVQDIDLIKQGVEGRLYNLKTGAPIAASDALDAKSQGILKQQLYSEDPDSEFGLGLVPLADRLAPAYAAARAQYAGKTALWQALDTGRSFPKMDAREVAEAIGEMGDADGQKMMFRLGAIDALRQQINSLPNYPSRAAVVRSVFGSQDKQDALRAAFPPGSTFDDFRAQMAREAAMDRTAAFLRGGSNTVDKGADASKAVMDAVGAAQGGALPLVSRLWAMRNGLEATQTKIGQRLVQPNGPDLQAYLEKLGETVRARTAAAGNTAAALGMTPGTAVVSGDLDDLQ
jgi:hypothetical protein